MTPRYSTSRERRAAPACAQQWPDDLIQGLRVIFGVITVPGE